MTITCISPERVQMPLPNSCSGSVVCVSQSHWASVCSSACSADPDQERKNWAPSDLTGHTNKNRPISSTSLFFSNPVSKYFKISLVWHGAFWMWMYISPQKWLCVGLPSFVCFPTVVTVFQGTEVIFQTPETVQDPPEQTHSIILKQQFVLLILMSFQQVCWFCRPFKSATKMLVN